jgi:hypothetical protein
MLSSSGYRSYDHVLRHAIADWRYRPFQINGQPAPVCTAIIFVYSQRLPRRAPPPPTHR